MISIITPIYNAEKYLNRCIDSILKQSYTDFELLLINDGSTDLSGKICNTYAHRDSRIRIWTQKNMGVSNARCRGVKMANGEYITFVDADDELHENSLEILVANMEKGIDIVSSAALTNEIISSETFIKYILIRKLPSSIWGCLFRKSLFLSYINDIPSSIKIGEDQLMNIKLVLGKNVNIRCIKDKVYVYCSNPASVTYRTKFTLEYEELFMIERLKVLGCHQTRFANELCYNNLKTLENLIACRVVVPYDRPWVQEIINWGKCHKLNLRDWIVLNIRHNLLCKYLLAIEKRVNRIFSYS